MISNSKDDKEKPTITESQFKKWMEGLATEILVGAAILATDERAKGWNDATYRARRLVNQYKNKRGLFQQ